MASKSERRFKARTANATAKAHRMARPGAKSNYAKKRQFLVKNGGWGFEYPEPKPWK